MDKSKDFMLSDLPEKIDTIYSYIEYHKKYKKYTKFNDNIKSYIETDKEDNRIKHLRNEDHLFNSFPFLRKYMEAEDISDDELAKKLNSLNLKVNFELFPFNWSKNEVLKKGFTFDKSIIENLSIIRDEGKFKDFINNLIPYSFGLRAKVKLTSPYFSHDDDDFYLIQNPCLKEHTFKIPMVRGSGWKGVVAKAGKELVNENLGYFESYVRVFGTGSQEYRELIDSIEKGADVSRWLIKYLLFEVGKKLTKNEINEIRKNPREYLKRLSDKFASNEIKATPYLQVHKGRAIFYPTYFDRLSLEIINPHSRKTRAGTNPIHYEVVPKDTEGILQVVYIPYDNVLMEEKEIRAQVKADIEFLTRCIEKAAEIGIGAKQKLGWGRFKLDEKKYFLNKEINDLDLKDWQKGEVKDG